MVEERFRIEKGMDVVDKNDQRLGKLENIYSENETRRSLFVSIEGRLLPVETIDHVEQQRIRLAIEQDRFRAFPEHRTDDVPAEDVQRRAYDAINTERTGNAGSMGGVGGGPSG